MMRNIVLTGYYGRRNTGDDALAATIAWGLHNHLRCRHLRIPVMSRVVLPHDVTCCFLPQSHWARGRSLWWRAQSDLHIWGGGSVLHDIGGVAPLRRRLQWIRLRRMLGRKTAAFGISIGPIRTTLGKALVTRILSKLDAIGLRDADSLATALSLDDKLAPKTFLAPDPALLIDTIGLPEPAPMPTEAVPVIVVCPCPWESVVGGPPDVERQRRARLVLALRELLHSASCKVVLLAMNGSPDVGDEELCRSVAGELPRDRVEVVLYDANPLRAFRVLSAADFVVSMRLHSLIFAYAAKVPFLAIDYHPKVTAFCRSLGLGDDLIADAADLDVGHVVRTILPALDGTARPRSLRQTPDEAKAQALEGFRELARRIAGGDP